MKESDMIMPTDRNSNTTTFNMQTQKERRNFKNIK